MGRKERFERADVQVALRLGEQETAAHSVKFQGWFDVFGLLGHSAWVHPGNPCPCLLGRHQAGGLAVGSGVTLAQSKVLVQMKLKAEVQVRFKAVQ